MTLYKLPLVLEPQPEGGYVVTSPLVPELVTEGETVEEAIRHANDALASLIETYQAAGHALPRALRPFTDKEPLWVETALAVP